MMKHLPWNPFPDEACVEDCVFSWPWQCHCDKRSIQYLKKGAEEERKKNVTELLATNKHDTENFYLWSDSGIYNKTCEELCQRAQITPENVTSQLLLKSMPRSIKVICYRFKCVTLLVYTWYYFHLMFKVNSANISEGLPKSHQDYFLLHKKARKKKEQNELQITWNYHKPSFSNKALHKCFSEPL